MTIGTAFHARTGPLNERLQWTDWSGYLAATVYHDHHQIEYNAIREAAALIDVSPLFKYRVHGPDAVHLVNRVITRDATGLAVGQVCYTPWCDEHGKVIDDGTVARLDATTFRWTAAEPQLRWLRSNAVGLDVEIRETTDELAAIALQGPLSRAVLEAATGESFPDLRYFRTRATTIAGVRVDVSRTGYTGDLGYELWIPVEHAVQLWDALVAAGRPFRIRPAGLTALDVVRVEAGLLLLGVDYTSAREARIPAHAYSPFELGLGRLVDFTKGDFVGRRALLAEEAAGGPARRLVGLEISWTDIEAMFDSAGLSPGAPSTTSRLHVPVFAGGRQIGRATSTTWSPILKKLVALASVASQFQAPGTELGIEWTVEARRGRVGARVVPLPFLELPRKRA